MSQPNDEPDPLVGRVVGGFTIGDLIRKGGFGAVYRAEQAGLGRPAVVKVLARRSTSGDLERFVREARLGARLDHPYAAHVYDAGAESDGLAWIAMELVRGEPLDLVLGRRGRLPLAEVVPLFERLCEVVHYAHEQGIVHRDIKPANVMVVERAGQLLPKLLDLGIARAVTWFVPPVVATPATLGPPEITADVATADLDAPSLVPRAGPNGPRFVTMPGVVMGTPAYMPPEQWLGDVALDGRADIYALGVLLFRALSGQVPYAGANADLAAAHASAPVPSLPLEIPRSVQTVVERAMAKQLGERFGSALELAAALREAAGARDALEDAPWAGLAAMSTSDAPRFLGREREVEHLVARIESHPLTVLVGASGVGKSSLVAAGLGPALASGTWARIRPGDDPVSALASALARLPATAGSVLVIDQLEELFTHGADASARSSFAATLVTALDERRLRVVATLRDDFLVRVASVPALRDRMSGAVVVVTAPAPADLRRILVEPARRLGYELDAGLAELVVDELATAPAALPLLSFTAVELWQRRDRARRRLTREAYDAMGGVGGALAGHAETTVRGLDERGRATARALLSALVAADGTRRGVRVDQLTGIGAGAGELLERLVAARLVVIADDGRGQTAELVHETLIAAWPTLAAWRAEDAAGAQLRDQLTAAAAAWDERDRDPGLLWRGPVLAQYEAWPARWRDALTGREREFAAASRAHARRGRRRTRVAAIVSVAALAIVAIALAWANRVARAEERAASRRLDRELFEQARLAFLRDDLVETRRQLAEALDRGYDTPAVRLIAGLIGARRRASAGAFPGQRAIFVGDELITLGADELAVDPTGTRKLVVAAARLRVVERASGKTLRERPHPGTGSAQYAPDGRTFALISSHGANASLEIVDAETLATRWTLDLYEVRQLAFTETGLVLVLEATRVHVHDLASGARKAVFTQHRVSVTRVAVDARRGFAVSAARDGGLVVWQLADGTTLQTLTGHSGEVTDLVLVDDRLYASTSAGQVLIWNVDGWKLERVLATDHLLRTLAVVPQRGLVAAGASDGTITIWEPAGAGRLETLAEHARPVVRLAVSADGRWLASTGYGDGVRRWDLERAYPSRALATGDATVAEYLADGSLLVAGTDGTWGRWDVAAGKRLATGRHGAPIWRLAVSPDGARVASSAEDGAVVLFDTATGRELARRSLGKDIVFSVAWSRDGAWLAAASDHVVILDAVDLRELARLGAGTQVAVGGRRVVTKDAALLKSFDVDGWRETFSVALAGNCNHMVVDAAGSWAALALMGGGTEIRSLVDGAPITTLRGHAGMVIGLALSRDGHFMATGGEDRTARIWDVATWKEVAILRGHQSWVDDPGFAHDGRTLATPSWDGTTRLWAIPRDDRPAAELLEALRAP